MNKITRVAIIVVAVLLAAGASGAGVWWFMKSRAPAAGEHGAAKEAKEAESAKPGPDYKYVTLDKVLVMLRLPEQDSSPHYLSMDLVFKSLPDDEKRAKDHLPLLRAVAVRALSQYTMQQASAMTVDQVADVLNKAFAASYAAEHHEPPFASALVGKLVIE